MDPVSRDRGKERSFKEEKEGEGTELLYDVNIQDDDDDDD